MPQSGSRPLFGFNDGYHFSNPSHLLWFALIGILGGVIGLLYAKGFYGIAAPFDRMPMPRWLKPAIGGLLVGSIAWPSPRCSAPDTAGSSRASVTSLSELPLWIVLILPFARILATGLSIGSGGSGGIFGPGMVIGAFIGASVWRLFEPIVPSMGHSPTPYVIVGMMCCFGSISRAPLAVMLMVAEMTGSVSILAPAMVAVGLAWFIARRGDDTIYRSQLQNRADAPAQRLLVGMPLLANVPVNQAMARPRLVIQGGTPVLAARRQIEEFGVPGVPVVDDEGRFEGAVSIEDLNQLDEQADAHTVDTAVDASAPTVSGSAHLDVALDALTSSSLHWIPVLDTDRAVIGTIATSDIVRGYRLGLLASLRQLEGTDNAASTHDVEIMPGSSLKNSSLRQAALPDGVIVTSIQRGRDLVVPFGDTVLQGGDRLVVIGRPEDIDVLKAMASGSSQRHPTQDDR